jgi:CDP-glucose 4,6-dehydratase
MEVKTDDLIVNLPKFSRIREEANRHPILVTGANGFKGAWLTQFLNELKIPNVGLGLETETDSLWSRIPDLQNENFTIVDLRDEKLLNDYISGLKPTIVIHLAAQPLVTEGYLKPKETFDTNASGTANLLDACLKHDLRVFQAITTDKVYKVSENQSKVFVESDSLGGSDPYSCSKVAAEEIVKGYRSVVDNLATSIFSVRAGNVIGGGDSTKSRLLPDTIRSLKSKSKLNLRYPNAVRPWQHVLDPLYGYLLAIEKSLNGTNFDALNFGPDPKTMLTVSEVVEIAATCWKSEESITRNLDVEHRFHETSILQLSSELAEMELGWRPTWSQSESIEATIEWEINTFGGFLTAKEACMRDITKLITKKKIL